MKKTRYRRTRTERALEDLTAEIRVLAAEVAMLRASQVQIVPYPYPQPYPVCPVPQPYQPWPRNPFWNPYVNYTIGLGAGDWNGSTTIALDATHPSLS